MGRGSFWGALRLREKDTHTHTTHIKTWIRLPESVWAQREHTQGLLCFRGSDRGANPGWSLSDVPLLLLFTPHTPSQRPTPLSSVPPLSFPYFYGWVFNAYCAATTSQFETHLCCCRWGPAGEESAGCARGCWPQWAEQLGWRRMSWKEDSELCAGNEPWADAWNLEDRQRKHGHC